MVSRIYFLLAMVFILVHCKSHPLGDSDLKEESSHEGQSLHWGYPSQLIVPPSESDVSAGDGSTSLQLDFIGKRTP